MTRRKHQRPAPGTGRKKLETPIGVQDAVIRGALHEGKTKCQIAKEQGIDRGTVARILSQPEVAQYIQQTRSELLQALPTMRKRFMKIVTKGEDQHTGPLVAKAFEGLQVFVPKSQQDVTTHSPARAARTAIKFMRRSGSLSISRRTCGLRRRESTRLSCSWAL